MVGNPVFFEEGWEVETREVCGKYLHTSKRFINIGANAGYYCIMAANQGIKSVAVEPGQMNLRFLRKNLALNNCEQLVEVLPFAISDKKGLATLFGDGTGASLMEEKSSAPLSSRSEVETKRWSDTGIEITQDDLLLIDVEGMEFEVLEGMLCQLKAHKPTIIIEIDLDRSDAAYKLLLSLGYKVSPIGNNFLFHRDDPRELS